MISKKNTETDFHQMSTILVIFEHNELKKEREEESLLLSSTNFRVYSGGSCPKIADISIPLALFLAP